MGFRHHFSILYSFGALASLFSRPAICQRPEGSSVCDYYAEERFGSSDADAQHLFVQNIVALAFEGGSSLNNVSSDLTGILRPGTYDDVDIDLLAWFNGSRASTNVNNAPIGINWLDDGGTEPLASFLDGDTDEPAFSNGTNQEHLFGNFYIAFARFFNCSEPFPPLEDRDGPVGLAYAHKFMDLNWHQLAYFIDQVTLAGRHFGVSEQDARTINVRLNDRYNVRCAPAVETGIGPQLLSLCQHEDCPLAAPVSDCAAYENLTADGIVDSSPSSVSSATLAPTGSDGEATNSPSSDSSSDSGDDTLGGGVIAGITIGSVALVALIGIAVAFFWYKKRKTHAPQQSQPHMASWGPPPHHSMSPSSPWQERQSHMSYGGETYVGTGQTTSPSQANHSSRVASPEGFSQPGWYYHHGSNTVSPQAGPSYQPAAEMDASPAAQGWSGPPPQELK